MRVEILNGLGDVVVMQATRVLVLHDNDTPAVVAVSCVGSEITAAHAGDSNFASLLTGLGIDRTVVSSKITPVPALDILNGIA